MQQRRIVPVEGLDDPRLDPFVALRDPVLRNRRESPDGDLAGTCIAEGAVVVERAIDAGMRCRCLLAASEELDRIPVSVPADTTVYAAPRAEVNRITGYPVHRGPLGHFDRPSSLSPADVARDRRRILVLEGVQNPTNVGVVVRSAVALGWDGLLVDERTSDPLYRRAARTAMGEIYAFPHARTEPLPEGLKPLRDSGYTIAALTPADDAVAIDEFSSDHSTEHPLALILGTEWDGLSVTTMAEADVRVRIPMHRHTDSLNVGAACAIACWQLR